MIRLMLSFAVFVFLGLLWAAPAWAPAWVVLSVVGLVLAGFLSLFVPRR